MGRRAIPRLRRRAASDLSSDVGRARLAPRHPGTLRGLRVARERRGDEDGADGIHPGAPSTTRTDVARQQAAITHTHPLALDGAAALCAGVATAAEATSPFTADWFLGQVRQHVRTPEFAAALDAVQALLDGSWSPGEVGAALGRDITALGSVPTALALFLRTPQSPADVILDAARTGGDTDTIAAMAGALVGAHCGEDALPSDWRTRLEAGREQRREARSLAGLALNGDTPGQEDPP